MVMTEEIQEPTKEYVLNASDRCDACSAQALVLVKGVTGELMFCGHHYAKNEKKLNIFAYETLDERDKIKKDRLVGLSN